MRISDIIDFLESFAPRNLAESWDNVGLLVGDKSNNAKKVLLALDVTDEVIDEAIATESNLIITHHPMIFKAVKNVTTEDAVGKRIIKLIQNNIAVYTLHTNLDSTLGGTNDILANILQLKNIEVLEPLEVDENYGLGRVGVFEEEKTVREVLQFIKDTGRFDYINYAVDFDGLEKKVNKVGLCTGSVSDKHVYKAKSKGCDLYVTGDLTYHSAQIAKNIGITIVDVGHYCSENIVFESLAEMLSANYREVDFIISKVNSQTINRF